MAEPFRGVVNVDRSMPPTTTRVIPRTGGTIKRVAVDGGGEPYIDLEREAAALILRV